MIQQTLKKRNFEEPKTKDKHNKTMNVMFKNKVSIDYADYRGVFNKKKVMECVEVKRNNFLTKSTGFHKKEKGYALSTVRFLVIIP